MTTKGASVHPEFHTWMRELEAWQDGAKRHERWSGLQELLKSPRTSLIEDLVRYSFVSERLTPTPAAKAKFHEVFSKFDPDFEADGRGRELELLAGMALALLLERPGSYGSEAALAITTTNFMGARKQTGRFELDRRALDRLAKDNHHASRTIDLHSHFKNDLPALDLSGIGELVAPGISAETIQKVLGKVADNVTEYVGNIHYDLQQFSKEAEHLLSRQDQEMQMLWWLTGATSLKLGKSFDTMEPTARPISLGSELADMTRIKPGPVGARAILSRAGIKASPKAKVSTYVAATDRALIEELTASVAPSPMTSPLHLALKRQAENGPGDEWISAWAKVVEMEATSTYSPLDIAMQFYRESLLLSWADQP